MREDEEAPGGLAAEDEDEAAPVEPVADDDLRWFVRWAARQALRAERERALLSGAVPADATATPKGRALKRKAEERAKLLTKLVAEARRFENVIAFREGESPRVTVDHLRFTALRRRLRILYDLEPTDRPADDTHRDARVNAVNAAGVPLTQGLENLIRSRDRFREIMEPARLARKLVKELGGPAESIQGRVQTLAENWPEPPFDSLTDEAQDDVAFLRWAAFDYEGDHHVPNREALRHAVLEAFDLPPSGLYSMLKGMLATVRKRLRPVSLPERSPSASAPADPGPAKPGDGGAGPNAGGP
jgi:hypothetical protein